MTTYDHGVIVAVVSGKGGSGKSLLTAVLGRALAREGASVLLVDMDIFVRGLTILVREYRQTQRVDAKGMSVADFLTDDLADDGTSTANPLIDRFFECDVLPAVASVGAPIEYSDHHLADEVAAERRLRAMLASVPRHDYVFLDSRAGMDSLIAASCKVASFALAVAEDDPIGRQTSINLISFLRFQKGVDRIYSITNKARNIRGYDDLRSQSRGREFTHLGDIPFDRDVLEDFGTDRFWTTVNSTLYFRAIIDVWNRLGKDERVSELQASKYAFPARIFMSKSGGRFTFIERMLRVYSFVFLLVALAYWLYSRILIGRMSFQDGVMFGSLVLGVLSFWLSSGGYRALVGARNSEDEK